MQSRKPESDEAVSFTESPITGEFPAASPLSGLSKRSRRTLSLRLVALLVMTLVLSSSAWLPPAQRLWGRIFPPPPYGGALVIAQDNVTLTALRASDGHVQWSYFPINDNSTPVIVGDTIVATYGENVLGLRLADGKILWQMAPPVKMYPALVAHDAQQVIVWFPRASGTSPSLYEALDVHTGAVRWHYASDATLQSSPQENIAIFCLTPNQPDNSTAQVIAIDSRNGKVLWQSAPITMAPDETPSCFISGHTALFEAANTAAATVTAFALQTGALLWQRMLGSSIIGYDDRMFITSNWFLNQPSAGRQLLAAYRIADGEQTWEIKGDYTLLTEPISRYDELLLKTPTGVEGIDEASGAFRWRFDPAGDIRQGWDAATDDGGTLYYSTLATLYALDAATGHILWRYPLPTTVQGPNVANFVYDQHQLYLTDSHALTTLDAATGRMLWTVNQPYQFVTS